MHAGDTGNIHVHKGVISLKKEYFNAIWREWLYMIAVRLVATKYVISS